MSHHESSLPHERVSLNTLPYDLLLHVARYLDFQAISSLRMTCKSILDFATTRPVFRNLAVQLLQRCRALPLSGFQRLSDLSTEQLVTAVTRANRIERAWQWGTPHPTSTFSYGRSKREASIGNPSKWYKVIQAPPGEEVDWLSPITTRYSLCATKSGKVVCWDVDEDVCLAEWRPLGRWELWKCRVEFDTGTVYFIMAKDIHKPLVDFVIMKLQFFAVCSNTGYSESSCSPIFTELTTFKTARVVTNIFILEPSLRLLSAFIWLAPSEAVGLYVLLDWDSSKYVFIDTGIDCAPDSSWTCILSGCELVIHSEQSDCIQQYFYPLALLGKHAERRPTPETLYSPVPRRLDPAYTLSAPFIFLTVPSIPTIGLDRNTLATNPYPYPRWYPESAHFVRQWWPTLPSAPQLSCSVVMLADMDVSRTRYILAQHYFHVPLFEPGPTKMSHDSVGIAKHMDEDESDTPQADTRLTQTRRAPYSPRVWYVAEPFEAVWVPETGGEGGDLEPAERFRPLIAIDFGHAVWIENVAHVGKDGEREMQRLRFVSFPPIPTEDEAPYPDPMTYPDPMNHPTTLSQIGSQGRVRTLEIPPGLGLDTVETLNIDQSQGAVIMSVKGGQIFILCYD